MDADTAYSVGSIEVQKESAAGNLGLQTPPTADQAAKGDAFTLARFQAGIKPEHRWTPESGQFSLAPASMVDSLALNAAGRIKDPKAKATVFERMHGKHPPHNLPATVTLPIALPATFENTDDS